MKAFFIANVTVKDKKKFDQYAQAAGASMKPFEGKVLTKGKLQRQLAGNISHQNVAIVTFPDETKLDNWYHSKTYQELIPLRDEAADMVLTSFVVP